MSLDLIIAPNFGTNQFPANISFNWGRGTPLADALKTTLRTAFPQYGDPTVNVDPKLVVNSAQPGVYNTLEQFASYVKRFSASILGGAYQGVNVFFANGKLVADDGTVQGEPKEIAFRDMIGQPTWIAGPSIQFKCPLRGDISVCDTIKMPQKGAIVTTTESQSTALVNLATAFKGKFYVNQIRHVGDFRQADAASWVSTFNAAPLTQVPVGQ